MSRERAVCKKRGFGGLSLTTLPTFMHIEVKWILPPPPFHGPTYWVNTAN